MATYIISYTNSKFEFIKADTIKQTSPNVVAAYVDDIIVGYWNMEAVRYIRDKDKINSVKEETIKKPNGIFNI